MPAHAVSRSVAAPIAATNPARRRVMPRMVWSFLVLIRGARVVSGVMLEVVLVVLVMLVVRPGCAVT
ncbi:hypothetical protein GCM10009761_27550 [Agromyces terreus]